MLPFLCDYLLWVFRPFLCYYVVFVVIRRIAVNSHNSILYYIRGRVRYYDVYVIGDNVAIYSIRAAITIATAITASDCVFPTRLMWLSYHMGY
jgi:hypothetical protein